MTSFIRAARTTAQIAEREWFIGAGVLSCAVLFGFGPALWQALSSAWVLGFALSWLFIAVLGCAIGVVRHAERLAELLGEPYGTLILTLSVTVIEVMSITAVTLQGEANPTLARETLFAVVMIILNGMVGLSLLIGAWRHREQNFNLQGASVYLCLVIPLVVLGMVLPDFTRTTAGPTLSADQQVFLVVVSLGLYAVFLVAQSGRHRHYFATIADEPADPRPAAACAALKSSVAVHGALLLAYLLPALYLAEQLGHPVNHLIETVHAPVAMGGVIVAILVATPEAIGAVRAALANRLQRSVNIFLGSMLSTVALTVPAMVLVSRFSGQNLLLGVQGTDLVMLLLTLAVSMVTFSSGRTNVIQGAVHLVLFAVYLLLIVQG